VTVRRATILLLCAGIPLLAWALLPMPSDGASPSAKLDRLQRQIKAKQGQIGAKRGTERVLTTQISSSTARIDALQRRQSAVEADLSASQARLETTQVDLRAERARLVRLRARLKVVRVGLATRLRELYTAEQPDVVTVVLESKGFAELLERGEFLRRVSDQDQRIFTAVRDAKAEATA
jgi:peptidoglycan hydrolase CwlO-like protein